METEATTPVKTVESEADKAIKQIAGARDEGVKGMRTEALTRMEHLKEYAEEGVNKLSVEAKAGVTKINLETDEALKQIEKSKAENKEDIYNKLKKGKEVPPPETEEEPPAEPPGYNEVQEADEDADEDAEETHPEPDRIPTPEPVPVVAETPSHNYHPRVCHIKKWPDFQGYGFNMHAMRGSGSQFIGFVDSNSPAESAGLRKGDRIIEINGANIEVGNFHMIVRKIQASGDQTKMLVVDPEADEYYKNYGIQITSDLPEVIFNETVRKGISDFSTPDVLASDPYTRILYAKALEEGFEEDNSIRVMVIGCYGQGKTSLVRRLVQQPLKDVMTTNGIEVQRCKCRKDGAWEVHILEDVEVESSKRLAYVAAEGRINKGTGEKHDDSVPFVADNTDVKENTAVTLSTTTVEKNVKSNINRNYPANTDIKKEGTDEILKADQSKTYMDQENHVTNFKIFSAELKRHRQTLNVSNENDISLNIWDFGGQFVYYATHQVFLSRKSVYILVFNIAEGLDKTISDPDFPGRSCNMTMRDYIRFWVTSVHSFVGAEDGTEPTIIMVGTHKDEIKEGINTDDIFEDIRKIFDDTSAINHFHPDPFVVSNTSSADESIDILRKTILDVGSGHANKVAIPAKWILLEKELKKNRSKKIVTLDEVLEIDRRNYCRVQTETQDAKNDQIRLFLRYHHALGSFCYFDDRNLSEYIVVDPQFLIDAFSCIVTSEQFCRVRYTLRKKWRKLCETAILEPELLEEVWRKNPGEKFHKFKELLTEFLQKHLIISEVLKYDEEGATSPQPLGFYIVPSFLKVSASDETVGDFLDGKPTTKVSLGYIFENETLTPTLYQKLLAAVVGRWPLLKFTGQYILFSNMVACELQSGHAGLLIQTQNKLELLIVNLCPVNAIRPDVCDMFRRFVEMVIEHEFCRFRGLEEYASQRVFTKYVRCFHKQHGFKGSEEIQELTDIQSQSDRHFPCPDRASHSLEMNHICQQWYRHQVTVGDIPKRRLTEKQYSALSMGIGQGWQQIGHQLGLGDISLQHIDLDNKTTDMKIFNMFLKWDANELDRATLDVLVKAIQECRQITSVNWDVVKNIVDGF